MTDRERRIWRASTCRTPLLATHAALDVEYEDPAVHREPSAVDGILIVDIHGPLEHHEHPFFASFENLHRIVCAALDRADVRAVVMRIDSPGGVANGMAQASQALRRHADRMGKPLYAYADEQICSAAYGIACAADEIWGPPTAEIGSVGVILPVVDQTKANEEAGLRVELLVTGDRKGDGHPDKPLDDAAREALQERVDAIGRDFFALVAESRGMSPEAVQALQAGVFIGAGAVDAGLADGVASFPEFLEVVSRAINATSMQQARMARGKQAQDMARSKRLAAEQAKKNAEQALAAAAGIVDPTAREQAIAKAVADLAALAKPGASRVGAESRYFKKTIKVEESVEDAEAEDKDDDDDEPESQRMEEDGEDDAPDSKRMDDAEDGEDDAEDGEDDGEEKKDAEDDAEDDKMDGRKAQRAKYKGAKTVIGHLRAVTGAKDRDTVLGRLDALAEKARRYDELVAKQAQSEPSRVEAMIKDAIRAGKVGPKNSALLSQLRAMSPRRLGAFLEALPRTVRTVADGPVAAAVENDGAPSRVDTLSTQARAVIETVARTTGKSIEQATADYVAAYNRAAGR
jgi:signal peptide peptidase SppA